MDTKINKKWYDYTIVVILLCIFFFPVGLYALWKNNYISKVAKIIATCFIGLISIYALFDDSNKVNADEKSSINEASMNNTETEDVDAYVEDQSDFSESNNEIYEEEIIEPEIITPPYTLDEYYESYNTAFNNIKLVKRWEQAPLYGQYADELNNILLDITKEDTMYNTLQDVRIQKLYDKHYKIWEKAVKDYLKYGEPDEHFVYINAACRTALSQYLNDPRYSIQKDKYYLKQTKTGYDYKLLIRGRNAFGAQVQNELKFSF